MAAAEPQTLRSLAHHVRTAAELDNRDPVTAYYCRLFVMQTAMKIDSRSPESRKFLGGLMDSLEKAKKDLADREEVRDEVVGQCHVENYALRVFIYADNEDRAGRATRAVVRAFYTASLLFDVISLFGQLPDELMEKQRYARWKATYIHTCLKNGETPIPGPMAEHEGDPDPAPSIGFSGFDTNPQTPSSHFKDINVADFPPPQPSFSSDAFPHASSSSTMHQSDTAAPQPSPAAPTPSPRNSPAPSGAADPVQSTTTVSLTPENKTRAQRLAKFAVSALEYDDMITAQDNLQRALRLLTTGQE
uniref:vacuolar protein sorting-associated protein VTA1 homolog n=1 Tax=Myxine glutinosa TaxID=7769 RepID=UPI00358FC33F